MYCMSPAVVDSVFLAALTCIAGGIKARRIFFTLRHWQLTQQTEMVNRIISHAQHILSSPAILLFLPPVALFTKKLCFVYFEWAQKRPFLPEAKRNEKKSFFSGELKAMKNILCSIFELISISMATWGRSGFSGQLPHTERDKVWQGHKPKHPSSPTPTQTHSPPWHRQDSRKEGEKNCQHSNIKQKKNFLYFLLAFFPLLVLQSLQLTAVPQG